MAIIFIAVSLVVVYILIGLALAFKESLNSRISKTASCAEGPVDPGIYDADYYLNAYSGDEEKYIASLNNLPISLNKCFSFAGLKPGEQVLDLGCGRGGLSYSCVTLGCSATALDYSEDAARLANKTRLALPPELRSKMEVLHMDFMDLDESRKFDVIFMADLVEHLYDWQLEKLFTKAKKLLRPGSGRIVVHTAPNRIFIDLIFPLKRILNWPSVSRGKKSFFYTRGKYCYDQSMHVNEQTPGSLKKHLKGFKAKVWCDDGSANLVSLLTKSFAGADIWAVARL
jgi:2-polyprenyl-3-methyl-5-hydroxy-6-metoxy-1,4-benzoquinol methylase